MKTETSALITKLGPGLQGRAQSTTKQTNQRSIKEKQTKS